MLKNIAICVDKETQPPLWTALALPFRSYRADQLSSAVVRGHGDCPFSAAQALRAALEGMIKQAQEYIAEIDAELETGTIAAKMPEDLVGPTARFKTRKDIEDREPVC